MDGQILCVGDLNPDLVVPYGEMKRALRQDLPGPTAQLLPGGGMGNTVTALGRMGLRPLILGMVGNDSTGDMITADLQKNGVDTRFLRRQQAPAMAVVSVIEEDGEKVFFQWFPPGGQDKAFTPADVSEPVLERCSLLHLNGMVVQDGGPSARAVTEFCELAAARGIPVSIDLNLRCAQYPLTPERRALLGRVLAVASHILGSGAEEWCALTPGRTKEQAARRWATAQNTVVCRDGAQPVLLIDRLHESRHAPPTVEVVSRNGAGDMFDAGYLARLAAGGTPREAVFHGLAVAAHAISHRQPRSVPGPAELAHLLACIDP